MIEEQLYKEVRKNGPSNIAIDVTSVCNFKCLHCFNNSGVRRDDELNDEEFINVIEQIKDMKPISVCLCGGEPLIRYDRVKKAMQILHGHVGQINMVSNGWFATKEKLQEMKSLGLISYQVSLDGYNAFQHDNFRGVIGAYDRAINAIKTAVELGIQTAVAITPHKLNHKHIEKIIDLCFNLGVKLVRSMPLIPMGRGYNNQKFILSSDEYITYQLKLKKAKQKYMNLMTVEWGDPLDHLFRMPINANAELYTFEIDIKSNGDIVPSTYFPIFVGNVRDFPLKDCWDKGYKLIWKNKKLISYLKEIVDIYDVPKFYEKVGHNKKILLEVDSEI